MFICHGEASRVLKPQTPIHVLRLQPACSVTSHHFHLPPRYESHDVSINISLNTANLNVVNKSTPEFRICKHLEDHWDRTSLQHLANIPLVPLDNIYKQVITSNGPMNFSIYWWDNRRHSFNLDAVFSCGNLCNDYRIAYTCRIRDILLLFLLVPTCQISMLTFTLRFYAIYYCEW